MGEPSVFSAEVVDAVRRHMNDDHADDSLLICRTLGGQPAATSATMREMDPDGIAFAVLVDGAELLVRVPWSEPVTARAQVRAEVVKMHQRALAAGR